MNLFHHERLRKPSALSPCSTSSSFVSIHLWILVETEVNLLWIRGLKDTTPPKFSETHKQDTRIFKQPQVHMSQRDGNSLTHTYKHTFKHTESRQVPHDPDSHRSLVPMPTQWVNVIGCVSVCMCVSVCLCVTLLLPFCHMSAVAQSSLTQRITARLCRKVLVSACIWPNHHRPSIPLYNTWSI